MIRTSILRVLVMGFREKSAFKRHDVGAFRDDFDRPSLVKSGKIYKYDIDLWFTSRVIPAARRLRVTVASAAFPKYDRNLNTGGDNERDTRHIVVRQRILHDTAPPSFVRLPIIPAEPATLSCVTCVDAIPCTSK